MKQPLGSYPLCGCRACESIHLRHRGNDSLDPLGRFLKAVHADWQDEHEKLMREQAKRDVMDTAGPFRRWLRTVVG